MYRFSGYFEYKAWLSGLSSIAGSRIGKQIISFRDGGLISIKDPNMEISGLTYGDRVHNVIGSMTITDHINKLEAEVIYNPSSEKGVLKSFRNRLFKSPTKQVTDTISIIIRQKSNNSTSKAQVNIAEGHGSWLEYIEFDGKMYWTIEDEIPQWKSVNDSRLRPDLKEFLLESDSYLRLDHELLREKQYDDSEKEKYKLEEQQRQDKKLREAAAQKLKKNQQQNFLLSPRK